MTRRRVLLVDNDPVFVRHFQVLGESLFEIQAVATGAEALEMAGPDRFDAILLDVDLGSREPSGIHLLPKIHARHPDMPVVMISGDERPETELAALRAGALEFVSKRPNLEVLHLKVRRSLEQTARGSQSWLARAAALGELVGRSRPMTELKEKILQVAPTRARVLIRGESGSGKALVASAIHAASERWRGPFVSVGGAEGAESLFDDLLFGHEKGSFTGAAERVHGRLEQANGGTFFLDEVATLPMARQQKLLRVIETGRFERVGGAETIHVDARWVTATHENLEELAARGEFRLDLLQRIGPYVLHIPPLRERREDIPELVQVLQARISRTDGIETPPLSGDAIEPLLDHPWVGNVRELESVIESCMINAAGREIRADHVRAQLRTASSTGRSPSHAAESALGSLLDRPFHAACRAFENAFLEHAIARHHGNVALTAREIGLNRQYLHSLLKRRGIRVGS